METSCITCYSICTSKITSELIKVVKENWWLTKCRLIQIIHMKNHSVDLKKHLTSRYQTSIVSNSGLGDINSMQSTYSFSALLLCKLP